MSLTQAWTNQKGRYFAKVTEHGLRKSSTGTPSVFFKIALTASIGADGNQYAAEADSEVYIDLYMTEKTIERTVNELRFLGWQGEDVGEMNPENPGAVSFVGNEYEVECRHELYKEKMEIRERWSFVTPYSNTVNPLSAEEQRKLNAMFGSAFKKKPGGATNGQAPRVPVQPRSPQTQNYQSAGVPTGGDIPF